MADCDWAILCDYAFLDVNRKMCLIGTFNQINAVALDFVKAASITVCMMERGKDAPLSDTP